MADNPSDDDDEREKANKRVEKGLEEFRPSGGPGDDPLTRNLKRVYAEIAAEPVPEHLLRLLGAAEEALAQRSVDANKELPDDEASDD